MLPIMVNTSTWSQRIVDLDHLQAAVDCINKTDKSDKSDKSDDAKQISTNLNDVPLQMLVSECANPSLLRGKVTGVLKGFAEHLDDFQKEVNGIFILNPVAHGIYLPHDICQHHPAVHGAWNKLHTLISTEGKRQAPDEVNFDKIYARMSPQMRRVVDILMATYDEKPPQKELMRNILFVVLRMRKAIRGQGDRNDTPVMDASPEADQTTTGDAAPASEDKPAAPAAPTFEDKGPEVDGNSNSETA
jgi:hypothetical protein